MTKGFNSTAKWAGISFTVLATGGGLLWATAIAKGQINSNTTSISRVDERLIRIERLSVAIAEKLGVSVAELFAN